MNPTLDRHAHAELAKLPPPLRALLDAELAAGNSIVAVEHGFPAPPVGAIVRLAESFRTRTGEASPVPEGLTYRGWPNGDRSSGYTDAKGHFFVLGPVPPREVQPTMDEIRAELEARQRETTDRDLSAAESRAALARALATGFSAESAAAAVRAVAHAGDSTTAGSETVRRFRASMDIDYGKWRDGEGYDVALLQQATPAERAAIEQILLAHGVTDWRDVEALAACDSACARAVLTQALQHSKAEVRLAVVRHAPDLVAPRTRLESLLRSLREDVIFGGLSQALDEVQRFHPPEVIAELWRGARERPGEVAVHFAAMLSFLHGATKEAFDWNHRPFFLKFHTTDRAERERLVAELRTFTSVVPAPWNGVPDPAASAAPAVEPVSPDDAEAAALAQLEALAALDEEADRPRPPAKKSRAPARGTPRKKPGTETAAKPGSAPRPARTAKKKPSA